MDDPELESDEAADEEVKKREEEGRDMSSPDPPFLSLGSQSSASSSTEAPRRGEHVERDLRPMLSPRCRRAVAEILLLERRHVDLIPAVFLCCWPDVAFPGRPLSR